jgi:hypothetical protein
MPMIATTIISSIRVKPFWRDFIWQTPKIFWVDTQRRNARPAAIEARRVPERFSEFNSLI